ncbi:MAG: hypothetical protein E6G17_03320 [Actinobacteria bacterium]|nr:MAG: hypothetical protein E6G17_03320 [Actinomycetota bacterium]
MATVAVRGKARPLRAFELLEAEPAPARGVPGLRAPMVGRDRELELLTLLYDRVVDEGMPHLVTVYADAGVGKSRLVAEFVRRVDARQPPPSLLQGRCVPYGEGITYWPLAEILKFVVGALDTDPADVVLDKIRRTCFELLTPEVTADPVRATAALAYTVGVEDPDVDVRGWAPRQVRLETHAAWRSFFSALAGTGPLVVVIEDIHWADAALLDLLEEIADRAIGPALFICPSRPELTGRRPGWGGGRRSFTSIPLQPLSKVDADRLVTMLLAVEELPATVRQRILDRAEGNPFFLEEILRQLIDEGLVSRVGDRWRATGDIDELRIPDTVQGVLAARIDLLEPNEKRALQCAAVVGRVFWPGPVAALLDGESGDLDEVLDRLEGRELVSARLGSSIGGEREFVFKHVLTRDVAYTTLPRRERPHAHERVARWIEETAGERRREFVELLAHHYSESYREARDDAGADPGFVEDVRACAFDALLLAAEDAKSKLALSRAQELAQQAVALAAGPLERSVALEALGDTFNHGYAGDLAWQYLRDAVDARVEATPEDRLAIVGLCARALEVPARWPGSMRSIPSEEAPRYLELARANVSEDDSEELVRLLTVEAFWPFGFKGVQPSGDTTEEREDAQAAGERAAAMALRLGLPRLASAALDGVCAAYIGQGLYGPARSVLDRRLELLPGIEDPWEVGDVFAMAAWNRFHIGLYREAEQFADEGFRRTVATMPAVALHNAAWRGLARCRLGDWDGFMEDFAVLEQFLGERREAPPSFAIRPFGAAAFVHEARGERAAADRLLAMLARLYDDEGYPNASVSPWVALVEARRGEFVEARAHVTLAHAWQGRGPQNRGLALEAACDIVAAQGAWDDTPDLLAEARAHAAESELVALPCYADRLEGRAALASGDAVSAVGALERARDGFAGLEARWEEACTVLALAEALSAAGRRDEASACLPRAVELFERVGSRRELAAARELATG